MQYLQYVLDNSGLPSINKYGKYWLYPYQLAEHLFKHSSGKSSWRHVTGPVDRAVNKVGAVKKYNVGKNAL